MIELGNFVTTHSVVLTFDSVVYQPCVVGSVVQLENVVSSDSVVD